MHFRNIAVFLFCFSQAEVLGTRRRKGAVVIARFEFVHGIPIARIADDPLPEV
jgi:hypothetical protein